MQESTAPPTEVQPPSAAIPFRPVARATRIESIDVTRGIALLGILVVNSLLFAHPIMVGMSPPGALPGVEPASTLDVVAWSIVTSLFTFKFISLFSMLFGVGAAIQFERASAAGRSFDGFFVRRMLVLLGFGVLHALLFWFGDILTVYALLGFLMLLICRIGNLPLLVLSVLFLFISASLTAGLEILEQFSPPLEPSTGEPTTGWLDAMNRGLFNPAHPEWILGETRAYAEGPYLDLFAFRAITWCFGLISALFGFGWHVLSMFCLGVVLYRVGFFGDAGGRARRLALVLALPIGLLSQLAATFLQWDSAGLGLAGAATGAFLLDFGAGVLGVGYAGLVVTLVRGGWWPAAARFAACAGRMALTVYLLETVAMTTLFYFYGFGLFGEVDRILLIPIAFVTWIVLTGFSAFWLARFRQGPMEAVWRRLAYGRSREGRG